MEESSYSQLARISLALGAASVIAVAAAVATHWFRGVCPWLMGAAIVVSVASSGVALVLGTVALVGRRGRSITAFLGALLAVAVLAGIVYAMVIGTSGR